MNLPNKKIFRGYDVRGIYPAELNEDVANLVGKAVGSFYLKNGVNLVVVGQDNRLSSPKLASALISGLCSSGCNVVDIGIAITPMIYFATWEAGYDAAINVTASHNPKDYNGFKTVFKKSIITGTEILRLIEAGNFLKGEGSVSQKSIKEQYFERILKGLTFEKPLKVVFDPGNGTATFFAQELYCKIGFEVIDLHGESDGNYPNHPPDPQLTANYQDMAELVRTKGAHLGIALDGDGDRLNFCDNKGNFASGDLLIAIFAKQILEANPGGKILVTVLTSQGVLDFIKNLGGQIVMWQVGHAPLKKKMLEENTIFCGEAGSGHTFFADKYLGYDDALYGSVRLCEIVSNSDRSLSAIIGEIKREIPEYFVTEEKRIACPDGLKFDLVEEVKSQLKKNFEIIDVDGVRFQTGSGWGIIRPSNTEPVLSIRAEGKTPKKLEEIKKIISRSLENFKPKVNLVWG